MTTPAEDMQRLNYMWRKFLRATYPTIRKRRLEQYFGELEHIRCKWEHKWVKEYGFFPGTSDSKN